MAEKKSGTDKLPRPPAWEWLISGFGVLLIVAVIGAMIYRAVANEDMPPAFELSVVSVAQSGDGYVATFRVRNLGTQTAANLGIEGSLQRSAESTEKASTNLTYVPGNSEREGGLFFKNDPRQSQLMLRATGYEKP